MLKESLLVLQKAVSYVGDASVKGVRCSARTSALANSACRALWLKSWQGDVHSKLRLCAIPFSGNLMFGQELETVLDRTMDRKKALPLPLKTSQVPVP